MQSFVTVCCLSLMLLCAGCIPSSSSGDSSGGGNTGSGGDETCSPTTDPPTDVNLDELIRTNDPVPGQGTAVFTFFGPPIIDSAGRIAFWAGYSGGEGDAGIFVWNGTEIVQIISNDPLEAGNIPDRDNDEYFGDISITATGGDYPLVWGADGRLIFVAPITGGQADSRGIFRWRASDSDLIRVTDMQLQEADYEDAVVDTFSAEFNSLTISDNGVVGYGYTYTYITDQSSFVLSENAVYASNGVTLSSIADSNPTQLTLVPDRNDTAQFQSVGSLISNNPAGAILLQATYTPQTDGDSAGVYLYANNELYRVIDNRPSASWEGLPSDGTVNPNGDPFDAIAIGADLRIAIDTTINTNGATRNTVLHYNGAEWRELSGDGIYATTLLSGMNGCGQVFVLASNMPFRTNGATTDRLSDDLPSNLTTGTSWLAGAAINNQGRGLLRFQRSGSEAEGLLYYTGDGFEIVIDELEGIFTDVDAIGMVEEPELDRPGRSGSINDDDEFTFLATRNGNDATGGTDDDFQTIYIATPVR